MSNNCGARLFDAVLSTNGAKNVGTTVIANMSDVTEVGGTLLRRSAFCFVLMLRACYADLLYVCACLRQSQ
jgi:hypothetical protein